MPTKSNEQMFDVLAVTKVQVFPFRGGPNGFGSLMAIANIVLNEQLVIRGLRVMNGENGLFVSYPTDPFFKADYPQNICNPLTRQLREHIENCVLEKYQATIE